VLRIKTALVTGLVLGLTSLTASAGELSYESRGYGGPLYIGPNFQQGGQHETPLYGSGSGSNSYSKSYEPREERASRHVAKKKSHVQDEDVAEKKKSNDDATEKKAAAKSEDNSADKGAAGKTDEKTNDTATIKAETENSSITGGVRTDTAEVAGSAAAKSTASDATASDAAAPAGEGCRHFVAAVGRVINVPCD
jgi:hypothetical protein